jgi:capsular exopolysaccharide synthesis family protein
MTPESQARGELIHRPDEPASLLSSAPAARIVAAPRAGLAGPPQAQAAAIAPMSILRALRRRSALALGVALLVAGIAGPAAWFIIAPSFKAQARLQLAAQPPKVLFQTVETQNLGGDDYKRFQSTQQTLVKSQLVLTAALRDPQVARRKMIREQEDPVQWLQDRLKVEFISGSEVMEISLTGSDPEEIAGIVNAVKRAYMDEVVHVDLKRRTERFDQLKKLKGSYADLLRKKRDTMRKLAEAVGSDDRQTLALRQQYAMEHLHYLQKELLDIKSRRRKLEAGLQLVRPAGEGDPAMEPAPLSEAEIDRLVDRHPAVLELADELAERQRQLETQKANLRRIARRHAADPSVTALDHAVKSLRESLGRRRQEVRPEVIQLARRQAAVAEGSQGDGIGQELTMIAELERRLNDEIKSISVVNQSLTVNTLYLQANQEEVAQMEGVATKIAQEVEALEVELKAPPRIRLIDEASVPRVGADKKRYLMVGMVTLGSFFGGLLGIAFLELQTHKVDTADEVPVELGLAVVGALPVLPACRRRGGAIARREDERDRYWRNVLLESIDATRTLLLHAARTGSHRVMMITSAVGGEGKTSLASYLATSLARSGLRTLLVDADLRSPTVHRLFDLPPDSGLSELLRGEVDIDGALATTPIEDLKILPAGRCDRQALRILSQGGIAPLFDLLKQRFDFIIVDSSPILPVADAMLIAQQVDAAIFSIFRDVSRKTKVKAALERLRRLGVPILGAVVTGACGGLYGNDHYDPDSSYTGLPESVAVSPEVVS